MVANVLQVSLEELKVVATLKIEWLSIALFDDFEMIALFSGF